MSPELRHYQRIQDFLQGKLQGEALDSFKKELAQHDDLREEVDMHRIANALVVEHRLLEAQNASLAARASDQKRAQIKKWSIAIGIVALIGLGIGGWLAFASSTSSISPKMPAREESIRPMASPPMVPAATSGSLPDDLGAPQDPFDKKVTVAVPSVEGNEKATSLDIRSEKPLEPSSASAPFQADPIHEHQPSATLLAPSATLPQAPCQAVHLQAKVLIEDACKGQENGRISLAQIQQGKPPYRYEIMATGQKESMDHHALRAGAYSVHLYDAMGCHRQWDEVRVKEVPCPQELPDLVFNPFLGETLELSPVEQEGTFRVVDKTGHVVYETSVSKGISPVWNGRSANGQMESGHYAYEIRLQDGTFSHGNVTLSR